MEPRETRSMRQKSSAASTDSQSLDTRKRKTRSSNPDQPDSTLRLELQEHVERWPSPRTPRESRKKVRFSDPGPQAQKPLNGSSTGLTPAMMRTSFEEPDSAYVELMNRTPSRRRRRQSTPIPRSRRSNDPLCPFDHASPERIVQFTPLRQILDPRMRRRIQRAGLSDEMNHIEREKRETFNYEKTLQALLNERNALQRELETAKQPEGGSEGTSSSGEMSWMYLPGPKQVPTASGVEEETSASSRNDNGNTSLANGDGDSIMINYSGMEGDTLLFSDSPDIRGIDECLPSVPDCSLLGSGNSTHDASVEAHMPDKNKEAENLALSLDLEAARKEKRDLFNACRAQISSLDGTAIGHSLRSSSPPPDFLDQFIPTLRDALTRASDATKALDSVRQELSSLGFAGGNVDEIIAEVRSRFRSARLELEHAVPGETADASLEDGNATLSALVRRVELLVKSLGEERKLHEGALGRETALRGQFNNLLFQNEIASRKIRNLEDGISSAAGQIFRARERAQDLEQKGREQAIGIDRLNTALNTYREEVKSLEAIVARLEEENVTSKEQHQQELSELAGKLADEHKARSDAESSVTEHETRIREMEDMLEKNRTCACDLTARIESLENEKQNVEAKAAEQLEGQEHAIGSLNVRVSELSTSLEAAKAEADRLRRSNAGLEEQLEHETNARDDLLNKWAVEQTRAFAYMKETVQNDRRRAKIRAANWELKSDDIQSDNINTGSEPTTPVSMTRFVDVEVGRGKNRRRLDSGIGILSEDMLDDEVQEAHLPSDPADL